ncbi:MAG TPA: NifU family protein [Pseudonocardiaceae bacterium]|nr:NifU family protein [Pseudonocardiaceae bacterium]
MTTTKRRSSRASPGREPAFEELAKRVDEAVRRITTLTGASKQAAEELKDAIEAIHRAGLMVIVRRMRQDERAKELLFELVDDPVVHLLLSLHGIIRPGVITEARRVLDGVRPTLRSHGGDVKLVLVDDGVAYVRLLGACEGGSRAAVTMRTSVEEALINNVPAITSVEVVPPEPATTLIPLDTVRAGAGQLGAGWVRTHPVEEIPEGEITLMELVTSGGKETEVIVVRLGDQLTAYLNACAHQGLPLEAALLDTEAQTLTCQWHGFCFDAVSGECLSSPAMQLEQLPLRIEHGHVWIRVET